MTTIDRYLLRQFLQVFCICYLSLTGLYIVVDAFSNLDEFLRFAEKSGGLAALLTEFYAYRSIYFFDLTSGILALIAAMFTMTWIQRHNELTALMAAGVSKGRVVAPVAIAAMAVSVIAAASREAVIPRIREELARSPEDLAGDVAMELRPRYDNETDILMRGKQTYANEQRINEPNFLLPTSLDRYGNQLLAEDAFYRPPQQGRPGGYLLDGVTRPENLIGKESLQRSGKPAVIMPADADWLEPDQCFVVSGVDFEQLTGGRAWRQFSSTATLIRGLRNQSLGFGADVQVSIHARVVQPFLDITLLFLGLPLVLTRDNRNMFAAVGMCVAIVSGFMLVVFGARYLGSAYLIDPSLAAWVPLMFFVPLAVALADRVGIFDY